MNNQRIVKLLDLRYDNVQNITLTRSKKKFFFFKHKFYDRCIIYECRIIKNKKETKLQKKEMDK